MPPDISIVIPCHNSELFIGDTILSICANDDVSLELVLILDDCSDATETIARRLSSSFQRASLKVVTGRFGSPATARNAGLSAVSAPYVAFVDHDDQVEPDMYGRLLSEARVSNADVVRCYYTVRTKHSWYTETPYLGRSMYPFFGMFVWNGLYEVSMLRQNGIMFNDGYGEDYEFNFLVNRVARLVSWVRYPLYHWIQHSENLHKERKAVDFVARADGWISRSQAVIDHDPNVLIFFVRFIVDNFWYIRATTDAKETQVAFSSRPALTELLVRCPDNYRKAHLLARKAFDIGLHMTAPAHEMQGAAAEAPIAYRMWRALPSSVRTTVRPTLVVARNGYQALRRAIALPAPRIFVRSGPLEGPMVAFLVPNADAISGGIISIFRLAEVSRTIVSDAVQIFTLPGEPRVERYSRFENNEHLRGFAELATGAARGEIRILHVPEVLVPDLLRLAEWGEIKLGSVHVNILNQNVQLMPSTNVVSRLRAHTRKLTQTTAHERYSDQATASRFSMPLTHISTYISPEQYTIVPFDKKNNTILVSHDAHFDRDEILSFLSRALPAFDFKIVIGMKYEEYKRRISLAKYTISFGEGLDNYFIESAFTGGIPFTIFNRTFMPDGLAHLQNVAASTRSFADCIDRVVGRCEADGGYRAKVQSDCLDFLSQIYRHDDHVRKLSRFYSGEYDFDA